MIIKTNQKKSLEKSKIIDYSNVKQHDIVCAFVIFVVFLLLCFVSFWNLRPQSEKKNPTMPCHLERKQKSERQKALEQQRPSDSCKSLYRRRSFLEEIGILGCLLRHCIDYLLITLLNTHSAVNVDTLTQKTHRSSKINTLNTQYNQ